MDFYRSDLGTKFNAQLRGAIFYATKIAPLPLIVKFLSTHGFRYLPVSISRHHQNEQIDPRTALN
jgi:hypothetical protein